mmetsp:Transcript_19847/g.50461  ORF Transcript_19847/g.50461 Transcript_19847/m.50461 type:complete len:297 (-) Transcript_19847:644-1534(-)
MYPSAVVTSVSQNWHISVRGTTAESMAPPRADDAIRNKNAQHQAQHAGLEDGYLALDCLAKIKATPPMIKHNSAQVATKMKARLRHVSSVPKSSCVPMKGRRKWREIAVRNVSRESSAVYNVEVITARAAPFSRSTLVFRTPSIAWAGESSISSTTTSTAPDCASRSVRLFPAASSHMVHLWFSKVWNPFTCITSVRCEVATMKFANEFRIVCVSDNCCLRRSIRSPSLSMVLVKFCIVRVVWSIPKKSGAWGLPLITSSAISATRQNRLLAPLATFPPTMYMARQPPIIPSPNRM